MALREQTYEVTALHAQLGVECATAGRARELRAVLDEFARRGFVHLWTVRVRRYRFAGRRFRTRAVFGPTA